MRDPFPVSKACLILFTIHYSPLTIHWGYGDFTDALGPGPAMKESLWPESHRYFALAQRQMQEAGPRGSAR